MWTRWWPLSFSADHTSPIAPTTQPCGKRTATPSISPGLHTNRRSRASRCHRRGGCSRVSFLLRPWWARPPCAMNGARNWVLGNRAMRAMVMALCVAVLLVAPAAGEDKQGAYVFIGTVGCTQYVLGRQAGGTAHSMQGEAWINGYLTAFNRNTPDTFDILGGGNVAGAWSWVENWCRSNPSKDISAAADALVEHLYPARHRINRIDPGPKTPKWPNVRSVPPA